jgi:uncharacterized protein (DUF433 family)
MPYPIEGGMERAMDKTYVEYRDGVYYIASTRVTLDSLVYAYREGHSPKTIAQAFWLDHEQVYGAIAFYLAHRQEVDEYIRQGEAEQDALREQFHRRSPALHQKLVEQSVPGELRGEPGSLPSGLELEPHHCPSGTTPRAGA